MRSHDTIVTINDRRGLVARMQSLAEWSARCRSYACMHAWLEYGGLRILLVGRRSSCVPQRKTLYTLKQIVS
jgi:hypothetical protein